MSTYTNCLQKFGPNLNLFSNNSSEPKMGGSAFIESLSNQLYRKLSNSLQFTNQEGPQNLCRGTLIQSHEALDSYRASLAHSFLKDRISSYASSPCELNDKGAFRHGCESTGSLNCPSNGLLEPPMNQPEINQTVNCQMPLEKSAEHKKAKGSKNKNNLQTEGKVKKVWWGKFSGRRQRKWRNEEDMLLVQLVKQHGDRNWVRIAQKFPMRAGKQCRDRWLNYLRPNIVKNAWSEEEDKLLIELHKEFGNKWAYIAKMFPERTENSIKNHWNATKRRHLSSINNNKNKNIKYPSLLKDYITSITSSSPNDQINIQRKRKPPVTTETTMASFEQPESSVFNPNHREPITSFSFDYVNCYKPEMVFDDNDFESNLVDELQFDPKAEMEFLDMCFW